jgi:hypothetical protein
MNYDSGMPNNKAQMSKQMQNSKEIWNLHFDIHLTFELLKLS